MTVSRTLGTLSPIVYFVNSTGDDRDPCHPPGYVMLAPYSDFPTPHGYLREYAGTLPDARRLNDRLVQQSREEWEREAEVNHNLVAAKREEVRERLYQRMCSSATSEYDREFIRLYLQLREDKQAKYDQRWRERVAYLHAIENDLGDRRADEEVFNHERINVRSD
jgi:hypothetical protein